MHFAAAIEAGKHVFMEKPVAVDPVGRRAVIETAKRWFDPRNGAFRLRLKFFRYG